MLRPVDGNVLVHVMNGIKKQLTVEVSLTAAGWELYPFCASDEKQVHHPATVASLLNRKLEDLVNSGLSKASVYDGMIEFMAQYESVGAIDYEPLVVLERALDDIFVE